MYAWIELPMPNKVIEQGHRLATTAENYEGIVFTDMQGNILEDQVTMIEITTTCQENKT